MIDALIRFSLTNRMLIIGISLFILIFGAYLGSNTPVDVFPNLNQPRVTVITEAHGLAPEEVETLVTIPLESALNGTSGVTEVRSSSGLGISIIYVNFHWGTELFRNRQLVTERLQLARQSLPDDIQPRMGPITSIMGEIQFVGLSSNLEDQNPLEMREIADWIIRPRLMSIPGVSQVVVMGGGVKQFQILVSTEKLLNKGISIHQLRDALTHISQNTTGGFIEKDGKEFLIRPMASASSVEDLADLSVGFHFGRSVLLEEVATIQIGAKAKRGEASINAKPAVVFTIQKQPDADTIDLTNRVDQVVSDLQESLPPHFKLEADLFKQANFIKTSIENVLEALRDGSIMVAIVLFIFLLSFRTTSITLLAIPMSFAVTFIIFYLIGLSINTMTLGGLAIAIGELVDDAIVDVENIFKRLKENKANGSMDHPLTVVYKASKEIRSSVVISTLVVVAVFIPLFALSGLEGRLFTPLGLSYIISLTASLFISLSLTPVLCYYLLPNSGAIEKGEQGLSSAVKKLGKKIIRQSISFRNSLVAVSSIALIFCFYSLLGMNSNFLPQFNEGTATIGVATYPGISLTESNSIGTKVEEAILSVPEVKSTIRRTGRAEMDEHAEGVHWSEIDVDFNHPTKRDMGQILDEIRSRILSVDDLAVNLGQPISHRIDHMMSGVRAQIAIKVFGPDPVELRRLAVDIESILNNTDGLVDIQVEPLVKVPQLHIQVDRSAAASYGITPGDIAKNLELGLKGDAIASIVEEQRRFDLTVRFDETSRSTTEAIERILVKTLPNGRQIILGDVAYVYETMGPNLINRENLQRRLIVSANSPDRALSEVTIQIEKKLSEAIELPHGYFIEMGGQYAAQIAATKKIMLLAIISLVIIYLILYSRFQSHLFVWQILLSIPLSFIGSIIAIQLANIDLSLATTVAFITLCGIASRNGILMLDRYLNLAKQPYDSFIQQVVIAGTSDRLIPILMTAGTAVLALTPLLFSQGEPGKEILYPVAVVVIGGLTSSTLLNLCLTPGLFSLYGEKASKVVLNKLSNEEKVTK